jgi:colicin import membrane protein
MLELFRRNPVALLLALLMHILIVLMMVFGLDWLSPPKPRVGQAVPVQATLIHEDPVAKRKADEARQAEARRKEEQRQRAEAKAKAEQDARERAEAKARAEREAKEQAAAKAKAERAAKELAAAKAKAEREAKEQAAAKARAEQEAKDKAAAKARAEQEAKDKAAAKARAEQEAKDKAAAKAKADREAREKAEREARAKAVAKAKAEQAAREAEMAASLEGERLAGEEDEVKAAIIAKVQRNWLRPPGSDGLTCVVRVRLGATGSVLLATVSRSSGNGAFDRSVEAAVYKADPLPMPKSSSLVEKFRSLEFVFKADNN